MADETDVHNVMVREDDGKGDGNLDDWVRVGNGKTKRYGVMGVSGHWMVYVAMAGDS